MGSFFQQRMMGGWMVTTKKRRLLPSQLLVLVWFLKDLSMVSSSFDWTTSDRRCGMVPSLDIGQEAEVCTQSISKTSLTTSTQYHSLSSSATAAAAVEDNDSHPDDVVLGYHYTYAFNDTDVDFSIEGDQVTCSLKVDEESCLSCSLCAEGFTFHASEGLEFVISADCSNIRPHGRILDCEATYPFLYPLLSPHARIVGLQRRRAEISAGHYGAGHYGASLGAAGSSSSSRERNLAASLSLEEVLFDTLSVNDNDDRGTTVTNVGHGDRPSNDNAGTGTTVTNVGHAYRPDRLSNDNAGTETTATNVDARSSSEADHRLACVQTPDYRDSQCFSLDREEEDWSWLAAGRVCVQISDHPRHPEREVLKVTFQAEPDFVFLHAQFWLGGGTTPASSSSLGLTHLPRLLPSGDPDTDAFRFFWCNSTGSPEWSAYVDFSEGCSSVGSSEYHVNMVAHSIVTAAHAENQTRIWESPQTSVYAYEYSGTGSSNPFSWLDFVIDCDCDYNHQSPTNKPTTKTMN